MRKLLLPLLVLAALALAAPALAKEPKSATVCGADDCATTTDRQGLLNLFDGNGSTPPPAAGDYYKVTMTIDVPPDAGVSPKVEWWYTASGGGALRAVQRDPSGVTAWYPLTATGKALMAKVTRGLEPFTLPEVRSVTIGGKPVADPSSYLRLFRQETTGAPQVAAGDWQDIVFTGPASPWTDNAVTLQYSPSAKAVLRGYEIAKLPPSLAAKIDSRSSLAPGSSFRWWLVGLAALVLAVLAAVALALRSFPRGRSIAKRLALPLFVLVPLAFASPALAKEPKQATLCGADGCATTDDGQALASFVSMSDAGPTPPPAAFYRMTVTIDVPPDAGPAPKFDWWWVPSANLVYRTGIFGEGQEAWVRPTAEATALLQRTVRDVKPYAVPKPTTVTVGGRAVDNPASYLKLFSQGSVGHRIPSAGDWQTIRFYGAPSPWTDGSLALSYSKHDGLLLRGGEVITLPPSLVDRIAQGSSLDAGKAFPWLLAGAIALALALAGSALVALRRRSLPALFGHTPAQSEG